MHVDTNHHHHHHDQEHEPDRAAESWPEGSAPESAGYAGNRGSVLTVRAVAGLSGDMMLAGLASLAELTVQELGLLTAELRLPALENCLVLEERSVNGVTGAGCRISLPHEHSHRTLEDVLGIIDASNLPGETKALSARAFGILAGAEAAVHGARPEDVTFHEVGALDSILDACLACRIFTLLGPGRFVCSPLPLADGVIRCAHGHMPSPAPAVLRMLPGVPVCGFAGAGETVTPTALSLLLALGAEFGPWPDMVVEKTVISYGGKTFANAPNGALWAWGKSHEVHV